MTNNYKEIKNYINNELKITKDDILAIIKDEVKMQIEKYFNDPANIDRMLKDEVLHQLYKTDYKRSTFLINTMDAIYNQIDATIHQEVLKRLKIELKEPDEED